MTTWPPRKGCPYFDVWRAVSEVDICQLLGMASIDHQVWSVVDLTGMLWNEWLAQEVADNGGQRDQGGQQDYDPGQS